MATTNKRILLDPLSVHNPITAQVLGICSALAVTVKMETTLVMCVALVAVVTGSNLTISLLRRTIPNRIRLIVEMSIIASLVIVADEFIRAYLFDISRQLSVFVGLIITNCIVLGRAEAFAMQNPPLRSFLDGFGNGLGYSVILLAVATLREVFGAGTWAGLSVMPDGYPSNLLAASPPGAFIFLGLLIWLQKTVWKGVEEV